MAERLDRPPIFTPFDYSGCQLLDGGLESSVPIASALNDTTTMSLMIRAGFDKLRPGPFPIAPIPDGNADRQRILQAFIESLHLIYDRASGACARDLRY